MIPHTPITLNAVGVSQWTHTGVGAQTLPAVAHPGFTEVTYCPLMERTMDEIKDEGKCYLTLVSCFEPMETHVESAKYQKVILFFHFHSLKNILNTPADQTL